jgi:hypothetical protein
MPVSEALVIRYGRVFTRGKGFTAASAQRIQPTLDHLGADDLATHRYLMAVRDHHVAHSIGGLEGADVRVTVVEPPGPRSVGKVGIHHSRLEGLSREVTYRLVGLTTALLGAVQKRIDHEKEHLNKLISDTVSVDEVYTWKDDEPFRPSLAERPTAAARGVKRDP